MGTTPLTRQTCPAGFFCPEGTKRASQNPCPAGTFNPASGQKSSDVCKLCPTGSYCPTGSAAPQPCPQGYYCLEGTRTVDQYPCPAGTFSGPQTGLMIGSQCNNCTLGSYCPEASSTPTRCPAGSYNPQTGSAGVHECLGCPPGWSCPHVGQIDYVDRCAKGHYCPGSTVLNTDHPCPAGTYTESETLIRSQDCTICPLRHACPQGTGGETQMMLNCGAGFFCPNGTGNANQFPCLPGTWSSSTSLSSADECDICPTGHYCEGGKSFVDGSCAPGHYCPLGTSSRTQFPCPSGTYTANTWLFEPNQCDDCPPGYYCPAGSVAPIPCKPGSYTSLNNTKTVGPASAWPACITCPAGYFCIEAATTPQVCGKGKYSASGAKVCSTCQAGYFCNSDVTSAANMLSNAVGWTAPGALYGTCYNGTYCPSGSDSEPALETDACPPGYFCPTAIPAPIICPAGTYSNLTGQDSISDCTSTPAGFFSLEGALAPTGVCSPGFYCPLRSTSRTQVPCPARYYINRTMGESEEDCALCVSGAYCPLGTAYPITCPTGYYCRTGISSPEPCPIGTYSNSTGLRQVDDCLLCPPGMYCDATALTVPRGPCDPGYYCTLGAYTSAPMNYESTVFGVSNRHTGDQCPPGAYCPLGSATPRLCPPGTFNNFTGLESEGQCVPCPPGEYCETPGLLLPTGSCFAGYYCVGAAAVPTQVESPAGYFSLVGATTPSPCPPGQYNLYPTQDKCIDCPAGFFCGLPGTTTPIVCPTGSYCPEGTSLPVKCPAGMLTDVEGLMKLDQCEPCPSGQYCDSYGLSVPSGPCLAGFVCSGGSPVANPVTQTYGYVCPAANYCPEGSGRAIQCPTGSFRAATGGTSLDSCSICPGGKHCSATGLTAPSGPCSSGHYCVSNASSPTPTDNVTGSICPAGFYCPEASSTPVKCAAGTYAASTGQAVCDECPMGFFCDGVATNTHVECPMGHYCPPGTAEVPDPCPIGTFSDAMALTNMTECQDCTPGFFCDSVGLVAPAGLCAAGSFCPPRSENAFGKTADSDTHVCPAGAYCLKGTYLPNPCPAGTYSNDTGLVRAEDCVFCDEGAYCADVGLVEPTGWCDAGYFCKRNNTQPTPSSGVAAIVLTTVNITNLTLFFGGQPCPTGAYCPEGSITPTPCPEGSYANVTGSSICLPCPAGYFCPLGCDSYLDYECPTGHYCPEGTERAIQFPCPPGSFSNHTALQNRSQCTPAPGGTFIDGYAAVAPSGNCRSGFYCSGGSVTGTPAETTATGGPCLPGTNCPEGSAVPIVCDAGSYCASTNTEAALQCNEGFYCIQGSYTATPTGQNNSLGVIGDVCTRGHYCPKGSSNPTPCPPGTYSENTQNVNASDCFPCPAGYVCSASGIATPDKKCPPGFFCTGGERTATQRCPKGFECPEGSPEPRACVAGTFADEAELDECKVCPERFYCEIGCIQPVTCPRGYFCPPQTPSPTTYPCLAGSFGDQVALASAAECASCPPGQFCSGLPPTNVTSGDCAPGHYCVGSAQTAEPLDGVTGGLCDGGHMCVSGAWLSDPIDNVTGRGCDPGFYCPVGSSSQIRCPKGTYNSVERQSNCVTCPAGGYCDTNATAPAPCPVRYYCPEGIENPVLCLNGTYGHEVGLTNATQCAPCSAGKYCVGGTLTASCAAGYYCKLSNDHPNPAALTNATTPLNATMLVTELATSWETELGGPCPIGHYCPEGVLDPIPCPKFLSRLETHGASVDDCGPCPAGMSCEDGANTVPCPAGSCCPQGMSTLPCPAGTFNAYEGQAHLEDCVLCDAGKLCNRTGILDLTDYDCPPGSYCLRGSSTPRACPEGSFRAVSGAKSTEECSLCVGGSFCESGAVQPTICEATTYCPVGSGSPLLCPGGSYCPYNSTAPVLCPEGFFCPPDVDSPSVCWLGHYCPSGTVAQIPCPLGYLGRQTPLDGAYTSLYSSCEACPPGTFGIDANRSRCDECLEGYVCLGATSSSHPTGRETDGGYPCPAGFYCPAGSSVEITCPRGSYQPQTKAPNASSCLLCPENSYQNAIGQASCLPCSTSAFAGSGATKCTCVGSHRAFQMSDGYCICEPGYEFYDQDMILRSDEDGEVDCQPIVYDRCGSNQVRSDSGSCVSSSGSACDASCNNGTGTYVASLGVCQCDDQPDLDTICDKKCREQSTQIQVNSSTGELQLYDPSTGEVTSLADGDNVSGLVSKVSCALGSDCQLHSVAVSSTGFSGSYDLPAQLTDTTSQRRRRLISTSSSITNPMVCLSVGDGLLFDLSVPHSYPIYLKDSMLNTNPSFDYGTFRALATKVNANASAISAFAFSFTEPGTYVFGNSLNGAAQTIIVVMKAGTSCPTEAPIVPLNEKNLITVSAKRRTDDLILAPDWALIMGLLGGLFGMVAAVIAGLYYFRAKSWTNAAVKSSSGYRAKSKQVNLAAMHSKGTVAVNAKDGSSPDGGLDLLATEPTTKKLQLGGDEAVKGKAMEYQADLGRWNEEDLDLRELVDRLQFHHEAVTKNFEDQKGDVKQLLQHLQAEAAELKRLFVSALLASDPSAEKSDVLAHEGNGEDTEAPQLSALSGRPRSRSVAGKEKFLLENLERDLQDRGRFEQKKVAMLGSIGADLREIESWGEQLDELTAALVQEMSSPSHDATPERTTTGDRSTCLEKTRAVLEDLNTLLGSDPATRTSSSLLQLAEAEKGRREVGRFVLEASQRHFSPIAVASNDPQLTSPGTESEIQRLLELHEELEKAQNKEDEVLLAPLPSLHRFGAALPQVLTALEELEGSFRRELEAIREEQNPAKERAVQAQMQSRLSKLLKEVAAGTKKVNEKLEKGTQRAVKSRDGAYRAENALAETLGRAKEQWRAADQEQKQQAAAMGANRNAVTSPTPRLETEDAEKLRDDTLFQIKELLVGLATQLRTHGVPSVLPTGQRVPSIGGVSDSLLDARVALTEAKRKAENEASKSAAEYASNLDASFPQLSTAEKERLLDDFASDLRQIQSSVNVEATRAQAELATRQVASEVLREAQQVQMQRRDQEDATALRAQHDEEEQSLESQFQQEELAIEQEYLKELSSLEQEFGDENAGDLAEPPENAFQGFDETMGGDESSPPDRAGWEGDAPLNQFNVDGDDDEDIIAQLNDVYAGAWDDRVRMLAMEEGLRKDQLAERLRRKRNAQKDKAAAPLNAEEVNSAVAPEEKELERQLLLEAAERKDALLEQIVKKQDVMDALQQEVVDRAMARLKEKLAACQSQVTMDKNADQSGGQQHDTMAEMLIAVQQTAQDGKKKGEEVVAKAEDELQHLKSEYERDFAALRDQIDTEQLRLEAKLRQTLEARQRRRGQPHEAKEGRDDDQQDVEGDVDDNDSPEEEMEVELAAFTDRVVQEVRGKHVRLQEEIEAKKTHAAIDVAVAEAQLAHLEGLDSQSEGATVNKPALEAVRDRLQETSELLEALASQIPAQIQQQSQQVLAQLHSDYTAACIERRRDLEAEAAMRRARLAEKMNRRRRDNMAAPGTAAQATTEALGEQERLMLAEIDAELKTALTALGDAERDTEKALAKALTSAMRKSGRDVESHLRQCQQSHEVERSKLQSGQEETLGQQQEQAVVSTLETLEDEASRRQQRAAEGREAVEREITRLQDESSNALTALTHALEAEKRRQEQRLQQRMAQRREQQHNQLPAGSSPEEAAEMDAIISKQEHAERQRLEDQLDAQAQLAFAEERGKQREQEDRLAQQLRDACVAEAVAIATKDALAQVQGAGSIVEAVERLRLWRSREPRNASVKAAIGVATRKQSAVSRLAALVVPSDRSRTDGNDGSVVADTIAAEMEQQIKALSATHLRAWQQRQQELQEDDARRKAELARRLQRKRQASNTPGQQAEVKEEEEALHQLEAAAIGRRFAVEAQVDAELEHLAVAVQTAGGQTAAEIEALLTACRSNFVTETATLRDTLLTQRQAQQTALRERLERKRLRKMQELGAAAADPAEASALDEALREEEATELQTLAEAEVRQLGALHDQLREEVDAAFAKADRQASGRCDAAKTRLEASERELGGIHREHADGRRALQEALDVERQRQQDKLLERMARRRAERLAELKREYPNDLPQEAVDRAMQVLEGEYERERVRLDAAITEQTTQTLCEHDDKARAKEAALQVEARRLLSDAEAAQAAREALEAAHRAEVERVAREFYACVGGGEGADVVAALEVQERRRRLEQRLAAKRAQRGGRVADMSPNGSETPSVAVELPVELQTALLDEMERELQQLHGHHDREWRALQSQLEAETRLRKTQLAERLQRRRRALQTNPTAETASAEAALDREEERENLAIDALAASATRALTLAMQRGREQAVDKIAEGLTTSCEEMEALLAATRKSHEDGRRALAETLETERRKQELALRQRLAQRRAARGSNDTPSTEAEEAEERRELNELLAVQEAKAWEMQHEREEQEVGAVLAPLEAAALQRLDAATQGERDAREELTRVAEEHARHLVELRASLATEKQRQELALREKLRRKREQRRVDGVTMSAEDEKDEERQALETLETSFEASAVKVEAEAVVAHREKQMELVARVCEHVASGAAQEAAMAALDAARLQAERVRADYEAELAGRQEENAASRAIGHDSLTQRLAARRQQRQQQQNSREINRAARMAPPGPVRPSLATQIVSLQEDDGSADREIASVKEAHARGLEARRAQLDAEAAARKAALTARLEHKRRSAVLAVVSTSSGTSETDRLEFDRALALEEQQELAAIEQERAAKDVELEAEAAREQQRLAQALREANERGAADIEQQLAACKLTHEAETARLEETLRAERARQELALQERLAAKRQRRKQQTGDVELTELEDDALADERETMETQMQLEEQATASREALVAHQQQELVDVVRELERKAEAQRQAAVDQRLAAERELARLEEELGRERRALQQTL
ncbi:hypothetical protein BBJ28_00010856, partial [Nothophytophthora sp. Chile5]